MMECNKAEALRAKGIAETRYTNKDFAGAKKYALKAQTLLPDLEGISQMLATFDVYIASEIRINGETDFYSVLGLNPSADEDTVRKNYRKLALLLHPDKNKTIGADGAFKLLSEAWSVLSDTVKRASYDLRRKRRSSEKAVQTNSSVQTPSVNGLNSSSKSSMSHNQPNPHTFWTVCSSCKVQFEYLRKYLNKRLSCKYCRNTFMAVETGTSSVNGSTPFCSWSFAPENGHGNPGISGLTYVPVNTIFFAGNGFSGFHPGFGFEYPNTAFQWNPVPGMSNGVLGAHEFTTTTTTATAHAGFHHGSEKVKTTGVKMKEAARNKDNSKNVMNHTASNSFFSHVESTFSKAERPEKKRKVEENGISRNGFEESISRNGYEKLEPRTANPEVIEVPVKRFSSAPAFDARKLLIDMARTEIRKKLEEMKAVSAAEKVAKTQPEVAPTREPLTKAVSIVIDDPSKLNNQESVSITVPDSDFHDFDKDRSEICFKPKQIWALYDEEDGMPRLYCVIRDVISVNPFKIQISHLNSKTDSEFGTVNWVNSGFTKSCGSFRTSKSDIVEQVNIFSHVLSGDKAGRGGCIRIFPKRGDIWAVYKNWSPDWNFITTPYQVRHQYQMVEVLDDYTEDLGVCVNPLHKMDGFKTVYRRNAEQKAIQWIPRREMVRFSHQVPSWMLNGAGSNLPDGCWDLDPAATPDELLHDVTKGKSL